MISFRPHLVLFRVLNSRTAGETGAALTVCPPVGEAADGSEEPEERIGENDPYGSLHTCYVSVALGVLVDIHLHSVLAIFKLSQCQRVYVHYQRRQREQSRG